MLLQPGIEVIEITIMADGHGKSRFCTKFIKIEKTLFELTVVVDFVDHKCQRFVKLLQIVKELFVLFVGDGFTVYHIDDHIGFFCGIE